MFPLLFSLVACLPRMEPPPPSLTEPLGAEEARAGVVFEDDALWGGISAEGELGDIKIYNDRAQFLIQGLRDGHYYVSYGGGIVDADVVRAAGEPGRDVLDDFNMMLGMGRVVNATSIEVVEDGTEGGAAVVLVTGETAPMQIVTGSLESPSIIPALHAEVEIEYRLMPGTPLLEITSTVQWKDTESDIAIGDIAMVATEEIDPFVEYSGFGSSSAIPRWRGGVGKGNEIAFGMFSADGSYSDSALQEVMATFGPVMTGLADAQTLNDGDTVTYRRYFGVGNAMSELTDAWYAARDEEVQRWSGTVVAGDQPVAGARVQLLDDAGDVLTLALTNASGQWSADAPAEATQVIVSGRGTAIYTDLPTGHGWYGPYGPATAQAHTLNSLSQGATEIPHASGYGFSEVTPLEADLEISLRDPGVLEVSATDGGPAVVRVDFSTGDTVESDERYVPDRPSGAMAWGYVRAGSLKIPVEAGAYTVTVHRGVRYSAETFDVSVEADEVLPLTADLELAYTLDDTLWVDPHSHAAPSGDGRINMTDRLLVHAAHGVQVHFGTDHDHVADYNPILEAVGLTERMASVIADEVSPVMRGHYNAYPARADESQPNHGAPMWWQHLWDTQTLFDQIREAFGEDVIIQANHPVGGSGLLSFAGFSNSNGQVTSDDHWSEDFQAIEVLNDGKYDEYLEAYLALLSFGYIRTPVGVSDSHGYRSGVGENGTFLHTGGDLADFNDDVLRESMRKAATVVSRGPYIDARVEGAWAPGQTFASGETVLDVAVYAPDWMPLDTVTLYRNGEATEAFTISNSDDTGGESEDTGALSNDTSTETDTGNARGTKAGLRWQGSFVLSADSDAHFVVIVDSASDMSPVYTGLTPWAMTAGVLVDPDDNGWTGPRSTNNFAR